MAALRRLSPLVEPLSLDEAFVDLRAADPARRLRPSRAGRLVAELRSEVAEVTGGLTASVGVASSKFLAKIASELAKPDGGHVVDPGTEVERLRSMKVGVIPGVGPVTQERLHRIGIHLVGELQGFSVDELAQVVGRSHAQALVELAYARRRPAGRAGTGDQVDLGREHLRDRPGRPDRARDDPGPGRRSGRRPAAGRASCSPGP